METESEIVAVTETWLNQNVLNSEILNDSYVIYRRDRNTGTRGGGILMAVKKSIHSSLEFTDKEHEILGVSIHSPKSTILLILCYRPPSSSASIFTSKLQQYLLKVYKNFSRICLLGDFNFPGINWISESSDSSDERQFIDLANDFAFKQLNNISSNVHGNILDLVFSNQPTEFSDIEEVDAEFNTDHNILSFDICLGLSYKNAPTRHVYDYSKADFEQIKRALVESELVSVVNDKSNVNEAWDAWYSKVMNIINEHVPKICLKNNCSVPWFDREVIMLRNRKNTAWRAAKRKSTPGKWAKYRQLRNSLNKLLKSKYNTYINNLGDKVKQDPKKFWSFVKSKRVNSSLPSVMKWGSKCRENPQEKCKMFNEYFYSVFTDSPDDSINSPISHSSYDPSISSLVIEENTVLEELSKLDTSKATGPDNISAIFLKQCRSELKTSICALFNRSLKEGIVPVEWRKSNVVPVFKNKNSDDDITNYRPISLLSIISKVLERLIHKHLYSKLSHKFYKNQHGFLQGKSTCTQLVSFVHEIGKILDQSKQVDIIYMDFSKAFDSVPHNLLIDKLKHNGICGSVLKWFESYLCNRYQRVTIEGFVSDWLPVKSGVPQGSILGPLLFLLYINDLPDVVRNSDVALFADDTKLYLEVTNIENCRDVQLDLESLHQWSLKWKLSFNASKCKVLSITRSKNPFLFDYTLNGTKLERVQEFIDLGVTLDSHLNWNKHVTKLINKAKRIMGLIKRSIGYKAPQSVKRQLYISLVRSQLEYCTPVWSGLSKENTTAIERVQRAATRYILDFPNKNYKERLAELTLMPLSYRRELFDVNFMFKCINNEYNVILSNYVSFTRDNTVNTRNTSDPTMLCIPKCNTTTFMKSYFNRMAHTWNSVPPHLRNCSDYSVFKPRMYRYCKQISDSLYNPDCSCTWFLHCDCGFCGRS